MAPKTALAAILLLLLFPGSVSAKGWTASLAANENGPSRFLAIDKNAQTFFLFEQKSPLRAAYTFPCATGRIRGDKFVEGDLKTPEGVYFVTSRLDGGIDHGLYGDLAFPLNFPNPVDRLKGKTGYGIWIHGRGHAITPFETRGCVALNNPIITSIDADITMRMPVLIAGDVQWSDAPPAVQREAAEVTAATRAWAKAWQAKSDDFFSFHDPKKFAVAQGKPFSAFKNHKKRLFRKLPWIVVALEDIRALPGPDYWVTWFTQFYRSPSLISQGVKRLYWQKDDAGEWKVVGMEFEQTPVTLAEKHPGRIGGMLAAAELPEEETPKPAAVSEEGPAAAAASVNAPDKDVAAVIEAWRRAWERGSLDAYMAFYHDNAVQGKRRGKNAIRDQKKTLWSARPPKRVKVADMRMHPKKDGYEVEFIQEYASGGGYADKGRKKIVLAPTDNGWRILKEKWSRL